MMKRSIWRVNTLIIVIIVIFPEIFTILMPFKTINNVRQKIYILKLICHIKEKHINSHLKWNYNYEKQDIIHQFLFRNGIVCSHAILIIINPKHQHIEWLSIFNQLINF